MQECNLSSRDAIDIRKSLLEEYESNRINEKERTSQAQKVGEVGVQETAAAPNQAEAPKRTKSLEKFETEQDALYDHCISCLTPYSVGCDCEVQKPSQLPF